MIFDTNILRAATMYILCIFSLLILLLYLYLNIHPDITYIRHIIYIFSRKK